MVKNSVLSFNILETVEMFLFGREGGKLLCWGEWGITHCTKKSLVDQRLTCIIRIWCWRWVFRKRRSIIRISHHGWGTWLGGRLVILQRRGRRSVWDWTNYNWEPQLAVHVETGNPHCDLKNEHHLVLPGIKNIYNHCLVSFLISCYYWLAPFWVWNLQHWVWRHDPIFLIIL